MIFFILILIHASPTSEKTTQDFVDNYSEFRDVDGYVDVFDVKYV